MGVRPPPRRARGAYRPLRQRNRPRLHHERLHPHCRVPGIRGPALAYRREALPRLCLGFGCHFRWDSLCFQVGGEKKAKEAVKEGSTGEPDNAHSGVKSVDSGEISSTVAGEEALGKFQDKP